jgi:hypothetical protein
MIFEQNCSLAKKTLTITIREMYLRIVWELVADHLGPAEQSLGTAGLGDRTDFVGT